AEGGARLRRARQGELRQGLQEGRLSFGTRRQVGRLQSSRPGLTARAFCWALSKQNGALTLRPLSTMRAAVAQLVRALGCGPRGRWFESTQLYQNAVSVCRDIVAVFKPCVWQRSAPRL